MAAVGTENLEVDKPSGNKHGLSRTIPDGIKRQVRQRCGFGCVICGLGLYEYEHFDPEYVDAERHDPEGITLLCPNHHAKKTKGTLAVETVKRANSAPKAVEQQHAHERFDLSSSKPIVVIGTTKFVGVPAILVIDGEVLLAIEPSREADEPFLLSANLKDRTGALTLSIDKNEWKTPADSWDCKAEGSRIEIRSAPGAIELILRQEPPTTIVIERLTMFHKGCKVVAEEGKHTTITTTSGAVFTTYSCTITGAAAGIVLEQNSISIGVGGGSMNFSGSSGRIITK